MLGSLKSTEVTNDDGQILQAAGPRWRSDGQGSEGGKEGGQG